MNEVLEHSLANQIITWAAFGLAAGVVAKIILPGPENLGWVRTIGVGILGSFVGGFLGHYFGIAGAAEMGWNMPAFATAVGGALILLIINRVVTRS